MAYWDKSVGTSDEYYTPKYIFDALGCRFDLDVAAPANFTTFVPVDRQITEGSLEKYWDGFIWMNPPFGGRNGLIPWLDKFFEHGNGIALTPDRTSTPWFWDAFNKCDAVMFTKKIKFITPSGLEAKQPSNGTALFAKGNRGLDALHNAQRNGLGIIAYPKKSS